jgi:high-affinity iron transporter
VGIVASVLVGIGFNVMLLGLEAINPTYAPVVKQGLEGGFGVVAIVLLSWMLVWMTRQAKALKGEVEESIGAALEDGDRAGWAVFGLIAIAVLREGFETVIFIAAKFQQGWIPAIGPKLIPSLPRCVRQRVPVSWVRWFGMPVPCCPIASFQEFC